ncbi:MAG: ABC transporter ATP-binding protein [Pirellulaceae bacterium]|jgi:ABC-type sugar transport system ATPase subunit|nr:ABC transporter ATP-binding protein [Pirellulaceae bacterium]
MASIEIRGLTKRFGHRKAIDAVSLTIDRRDHLAILGPSGAGKSTLLRIIAGLERCDMGELRIDGRLANDLPPDQRSLAYMSQDYALYPQLNVRRNLETALLSLKLSSSERDVRCAEALAWFDIEPLTGQFPAQLSGGQAQRVALAKALIRRPDWLLLDEPFSQLDCRLRDELRGLLTRVCEHYQTCLVFVTHDPLDAFRMASKLALLDDGRLLQCAPPLQVYQTPSCRSSAELISPWGVNWLCSQSLDEAAAWSSPELIDDLRTELAGEICIGFRPENAQLQSSSGQSKTMKSSSGGSKLVLPVTVERVQSLGFAQWLTVCSNGQHYLCLVPHLPKIPAEKVDEQSHLVIAAEALLHCRRVSH